MLELEFKDLTVFKPGTPQAMPVLIWFLEMPFVWEIGVCLPPRLLVV